VKLTGYSCKRQSTTQDLFYGALVDQVAFDAINKAKEAGEHFSQELIIIKKIVLGFGQRLRANLYLIVKEM
jgi:hypothetical protein